MDAIIILLWTYHNVSTGCNSKDTIIIDKSIIFYFIDKPITTIIQWLVYSLKAFINNYWVIIIVTAVFAVVYVQTFLIVWIVGVVVY